MDTYHGTEPPEDEGPPSPHNSKKEYLEEFGQIMRDLIQEAENP